MYSDPMGPNFAVQLISFVFSHFDSFLTIVSPTL